MTQSDIAFLSASELQGMIARKDISPVEATRQYLDRIDALNPGLNAFLTVTAENALQSARVAEQAVMRGDVLGPLHGVPISIKDVENTRGVRTTTGSLVYRDRIPTFDSIVVERVRRSGAVILGKTNTPEFGLLARTENRLGDPCGNPWAPDRTAGGSSGGAAAAVAAGLCSISTGTDGGGSIRIPAAFCGVYGIKPTQGRVPGWAGPDATPTVNMFVQAGPISRTVRDAALLLQALAGRDTRDPGALRESPADYVAATERDIRGLRIAWSTDYGFAAVDPEVADVARKAAMVFEDMGCRVEEIDLDIEPPFEHFWQLYTAVTYARAGHLLRDRADELTWYTRESLEIGATVTGADYVRELGWRQVLTSQILDVFERYDILLGPTMATVAFPHGSPPSIIGGRDVKPFSGFTPFTMVANVVGNPAASAPCGFVGEGLPVGLHIMGRPGDEATVLAASAAFERAQPWAHHRPPGV